MIKEEMNISKSTAIRTPSIMKRIVKTFDVSGSYNWEKQTMDGVICFGTTNWTRVPTGNSQFGNDSDSITD